MVKKREPRAPGKPELSKEAVEAFAAAADGAEAPEAPELDMSPNANRDYKSVRMNFNAFEYSKLELVAEKTGRSKMGSIRWAVVQMARKLARDEQDET